MPAPYSNDLRQKAVDAVKRGEKKVDVAQMYQISRNTLDLWLKRAAETGSVSPAKAVRLGPSRKISEEKKFIEFVLEHEDKTQEQLAELWGEGVTQQNISKACQRLGITRKKKLTAMKKGMKKKEPHS